MSAVPDIGVADIDAADAPTEPALAPAPLPTAAPVLSERMERWLRRIVEPLKRYHRHRVVGMDHVPRQGPALLVVNHSLATYDTLLLCAEIYDRTGRAPVGLADDMVFKVGRLGRLAREAGAFPASPETGRALLAAGHIVMVAPGGMREALRPSHERYQVQWDDRRGFVRLALRTGTPLLLAGCRAADDIYTVYPSLLTELAYAALKFPFPVVQGLGPSPVPRPVRLTHHLAAPIVPPPVDEDRLEAQVDALHARCRQVMQDLLSRP